MAFPTSPGDGDEYTTVLGTRYKYQLADDKWYIMGDLDDPDAIHDNVDNEITAITPKTTPVTADEFIIEDSAASFVKKAVTYGNLETTIRNHAPASHTLTSHSTRAHSELTDAPTSAHHVKTVSSEILLDSMGEKNHVSLADKNGETDVQHLTATEKGLLHTDVVTTVAHVEAVSINNVVEDVTPQLGGPLDLNAKAFTEELVAAVSLVAGNLCYMNGSGKMDKAQADAEATCDTLLAMCLDTISADSTGTFLIFGKWTTTGLTAGVNYYVSDLTAGAITLTPPTTTGDIQRFIGTSVSTTVLYFNPDHSYVEYVV